MRAIKICGVMLLFFMFVGATQSQADDDQVLSSTFTETPSTVEAAPQQGETVQKPQPFAGNSDPIYLPVISYPAIAIGFAYDVFEIVNQERANAGCQPLALNSQLTEAANAHTLDMAHNDFFSHTGSDGSSPWVRINRTGYQYNSAGENIAAGYSTPEAVMAGWMNSSGHRANILNCNFQEIGVSHVYINPDIGNVNYHHYWTQVFARPAN